jgi:uncharacterized repeat protein (TIGR03803 family)
MKIFRTIVLALNLMVIVLAVIGAHAQVQGVAYTTLAAFNNTKTGASPYNPPVLGAGGNLYGALPGGGKNGVGVIYKISTNGTQTTLYTFNTNNGANPIASLVSARDGNFYGVAIGGTVTGGGTNNNQGTIFKVTTNGTFTLLYTFGMMTNNLGYALDGANPYGALIQGWDGNFYGVTYNGGISNAGTVFQFSTNGTLTTLHSFTGAGTNDDGAHPYLAPLVEGAAGVFYGTTSAGGTNNGGTIFQITADGTLNNLLEFNSTNGFNPFSGLSFGTDGNLYGTTVYGGTYNRGTAFQITTNGALTTLFQFGGTDGLYYPVGGVVPGNNNTLFGTTFEGGTQNFGTVFQLATNGVLTTLHSFTNGSDGANCYAGVIRDASGNLYGAASAGGKQGGFGTIYSLNFSMILSITSPTANEFWSNSVFTITGMASDNAPGRAVTNVLYSLNSAAWTNPITTNGWNSWTSSILLAPGTNTLRAYAMDDVGNISATDTVKFVYGATLTVLTNGAGTISPNYNGAQLPLDASYSMTAKAAAGFAFANWTGGTNLPLNVVTNGTTVKFLIESNLMLQANFMDVTKPTLSITNVKAGMNVSNADFTVKGKAGDNVAVSNVLYSLNDTGWSNAVTVNNWSNWTAAVTLNAGTNTIAAYAVDTTGNVSTTTTLKFFYVVNAPLTVSTNGKGTVSLIDNGALLLIGRSYLIEATAGTGFAFANWTGGTSLPLNVLTNGTTLKFLMESNLMLQANFLDVTKPALTIKSPTSGQKMTNALATVIGTATDNWQVGSVWYQLNGGAWSPGMTANGYTNWTSSLLTLVAGTNSVNAYAVDLGGNFSATNRVSFVSSNTFLLQLDFAIPQPLTSTGLNFTLQLSPGLNGHIQFSTNLTAWAALTNFMGTNTTLNFHDAEATNSSQRFYRAVIP